MAITLDTADLIYPLGELQNSMFPDGDLEQAVSAWLLIAKSKTTDDQPALHFVYWRAYDAVANRLAAQFSNENYYGNVSRSISTGQVNYYRDKAEAHMQEYNRLTGNESFVKKEPTKMFVY